jgi:DNA-binding Lrp family transcriptional regulator
VADRRKIGAYVLMKISPGKSRAITEQVAKIESVKTAYPVTSIYDIFAYLEASDINNLTATVRTKIQTIDGVLRTHTAIVGELVTTSE